MIRMLIISLLSVICGAMFVIFSAKSMLSQAKNTSIGIFGGACIINGFSLANRAYTIVPSEFLDILTIVAFSIAILFLWSQRFSIIKVTYHYEYLKRFSAFAHKDRGSDDS